MRAAFIGTYVPRRCGIATFTEDISTSVRAELTARLKEPGASPPAVFVAAMNDPEWGIRYSDDVAIEISVHDSDAYIAAADSLNHSGVDVVSLQHEYGIFGGADGAYILLLLKALDKPVVTTLHTVLKEPSPGQRQVLEQIVARSSALIVMSEKGRELLMDVYGIAGDKIHLIHHGVPDVPFSDPDDHKAAYDAVGRKTILTFGLIGPSKSIETAIEAVARIVDRHPDVLYLVLGETHPELTKRYGEAYRESLLELVRERGLENHVRFIDEYLSLDDLCDVLQVADVYVTPYISKEQVVSGTLAYAVGAGRAVISTPYWYATEVLSGGRGLLFDFGDIDGLARHLDQVLSDDLYRSQLRKKAYEFGRRMTWKEVAREYCRLFSQVSSRHANARAALPELEPRWSPLPQPNLAHLKALTDSTGIIQHATYSTPNRGEGYCTDDNARALIACLGYERVIGDGSTDDLVQTYISFLSHAQQRDGRFHNFLAYDRRWLDEVGSDDCHGRALWALGAAIANCGDRDLVAIAKEMFDRALPAIEGIRSPRAEATACLGCALYLDRFPGAHRPREVAQTHGRQLAELYQANRSDDWEWLEPCITYDNGLIPAGLFAAARVLHRMEWASYADAMLTFLVANQTRNGHLSIIGNQGWYAKGGTRARFDQQPLEAAALAEAAVQGVLAGGRGAYREAIGLAVRWFLGGNDLNALLYDEETGGCRDGLTPTGGNQNQGAESTVSYLMTLCRALESADTMEGDEEQTASRMGVESNTTATP